MAEPTPKRFASVTDADGDAVISDRTPKLRGAKEELALFGTFPLLRWHIMRMLTQAGVSMHYQYNSYKYKSALRSRILAVGS